MLRIVTQFWKMNQGCKIMDPVTLGVKQALVPLFTFEFSPTIFSGRSFYAYFHAFYSLYAYFLFFCCFRIVMNSFKVFGEVDMLVLNAVCLLLNYDDFLVCKWQSFMLNCYVSWLIFAPFFCLVILKKFFSGCGTAIFMFFILLAFS